MVPAAAVPPGLPVRQVVVPPPASGGASSGAGSEAGTDRGERGSEPRK
ncbi:MAG: hypothetical protein U1F67_12750 [Rubrivivax sp.]